VSFTPVANLPPPVSLIPVASCHWHGAVDTGSKFAADIVDTGGKFATGVNNTSNTGGNFFLPPVSLIPVVHLDLQISPPIFEKI
jgi:hypothetical protein